MIITVIALIGAKGLLLLYLWLGSAIAASWLSNAKGYGEKPGLASGLVLSVVGVFIWLIWKPRPHSRWAKRFGMRGVTGSGPSTVGGDGDDGGGD